MKKHDIDKIKKLSLDKFEEVLKDMASWGELDSAIDENSIMDLEEEIEPVTLSDEELERLYDTAKKASMEKALMDTRKKVSPVNQPFGRWLQFIRDKSGLLIKDIAKLLRKDERYVENIENGQADPLALPIIDVANIMELFTMTVSEFINAAEKYMLLSGLKNGNISAMARSPIEAGTRKRADSISHAVDAVLLKIGKNNKESDKSEKKVDPNYIEKLKATLKERGRTDLLI